MRDIRRAAGITQAALAKAACCSASWITELEGGYKLPSVRLAEAIAHQLGVRPEEIFGAPHLCACGCGLPTYAKYAHPGPYTEAVRRTGQALSVCVLTAHEAARRAEVAPGTVYLAIEQRKLATVRTDPVGITATEVDRWIAARREAADVSPRVTVTCSVCGETMRRRRSCHTLATPGPYYCQKHAATGRWAHGKAEREARNATIRGEYEDGVPTSEIAARHGISEALLSQIRKAAGAPNRPPARKHPKPGPRECANPTCPHGETGRPRIFEPDATTVANGYGSYCSRKCARQSPEGREVGRRSATERHSEADQALARLQAENPTWRNTRQIAEDLCVAENTVTGIYIPKGIIEGAQRELVCGEWHWFATEDAVRKAKREIARSLSESGNRRRWFDADYVLAQWRARGRLSLFAERRGLTEDEAEAIVRRRVAKRRELLRYRAGRKPEPAPPAHHLGWAEAFARLRLELEDYAAMHGEAPPTNLDVALAVAEEDFAAHRERRWKDYPASRSDRSALDPRFAREAQRRVWYAVKPLLSAVSEITAS